MLKFKMFLLIQTKAVIIKFRILLKPNRNEDLLPFLGKG